MMVLPEDVRVFLDELFSDERPSFLPPFLPNSEKIPTLFLKELKQNRYCISNLLKVYA